MKITDGVLKVTFVSWWPMTDVDINNFNISDRFFLNFLEKKFDCKTQIVGRDEDPQIVYASVFDPDRESVIRYLDSRPTSLKIFYSGENLRSRFTLYRDHLIDHVDIALGFEKLASPKSLRFPIWLTSTFDKKTFYDLLVDDPNCDLNKYFKTKGIKLSGRGFCSLCCSWSGKLNRGLVFETLNKYKRVDSCGAFMKNSDLLDRLDQDITAYLQKFNFNICMENSKSKTYTTEKIFNAIYADTIPIYFNGHIPEPGVLNSDRIINLKDKNALDSVKCHDDNYRDIYNKDIFVEGANDVIMGYYKAFAAKLLFLFSRSHKSSV